MSHKLCVMQFFFQNIIFDSRLPEWAEKAIEVNSTMENIALFDVKIYASTPQLARLSSGFLLKEMLERFSRKINSTLKPDRSIWFYSTHYFTLSNLLNSLGLFEQVF